MRILDYPPARRPREGARPEDAEALRLRGLSDCSAAGGGCQVELPTRGRTLSASIPSPAAQAAAGRRAPGVTRVVICNKLALPRTWL